MELETFRKDLARDRDIDIRAAVKKAEDEKASALSAAKGGGRRPLSGVEAENVELRAAVESACVR